MKNKVTIFWFRRDLRLDDNVGLHHALAMGFPVLPIFIFDPQLLSRLSDKVDRRVDYIHQALTGMNEELKEQNATLHTFYNDPATVLKDLSEQYEVHAVVCNRDYEPEAIKRDTAIYSYFKQLNISFKAFKDQVIFDKGDILKNEGKPYTIYTPYRKKWIDKLCPADYQSYPINRSGFYSCPFVEILPLQAIGFHKTSYLFDKPQLDITIIEAYDKYRDFPALQKTTQLGTALRFGTISIRQCVSFAVAHNNVWLSELIWREFFMQILYHFPAVVLEAFKKQYDDIQWRNNEDEFMLWCQGKTGYPLVDAGMRQLNETGYMHNRVRMVVASFLCKHLLIDWRWGEAYFAQKLNDYDLSANNGNWQWAAGCGCDAAPYFRVFNPTLQVDKFDKKLEYVNRWVPEYNTSAYPTALVDHAFARSRALKVYAEGITKRV